MSQYTVNLHLTPEMRQMSVYHLCYCLQSLLLLLRKNQFFSSPKTSQQSVRNPIAPSFNSTLLALTDANFFYFFFNSSIKYLSNFEKMYFCIFLGRFSVSSQLYSRSSGRTFFYFDNLIIFLRFKIKIFVFFR